MTLRNIFKKTGLAGLLAIAIPLVVAAQTDADIKAMQQRMLEMQRQMMQQFGQNSPKMGFGQPSDTSFFNFKIDTSFFGDGAEMFRISPFGMDSMPDGGADFDQFFKQFFGSDGAFGPGGKLDSSPEGSEFLDENGADDLLPEERLRQREQGQNPEKNALPLPEQKAKKRATVRI